MNRVATATIGTGQLPSAPDAMARGDDIARWLDLAGASSEPNPFYHPALLLPALTHLAEGAQVRVIEAYREGLLIGMMPVLAKARHARYAVHNVGNWLHDQCFFGAPLLRKGRETEAWAGLLDQLDGAGWSGNFLHLDALWFDGPVADALRRQCAAEGRNLTLIARHERALLQSDLSPDAYWQTHVRAKKRKEIRRLANRLSELGALSHRRFARGDALDDWIADFLTLERFGWKGAEGTALDSRQETRAYFSEAMNNAARADMLDMLRIDLDDVPIAMLVNLRLGSGAFSYKIAFDERFARFSPGVLIEMDNLHSVLGDGGLDWMDSCAAPNHPMIDGIWAERRTIGQFRVALKGKRLSGLKRRTAYAATGFAERAVRAIRGKTQ